MNVHVCARPKFVFCLFQNVKEHQKLPLPLQFRFSGAKLDQKNTQSQAKTRFNTLKNNTIESKIKQRQTKSKNPIKQNQTQKVATLTNEHCHPIKKG